ncbi:MAG: deoxyribodipyrimidine photolyase [bacterium]
MKKPSPVPAERVRAGNAAPIRTDGAYILYWMVAARRTTWSFALQRAVEHAATLGRPLLVLEALRCDHRWASDRLHAFVLQGMADNAKKLAARGVAYHAYVEPSPGAGKGLLDALARDACVVVTDDFPAFFLPRMIDAASRRLPVKLEAVDSNGILPMRVAPRVFPTAHAFRRFLQKTLAPHFDALPEEDPLRGRRLATAAIPADVTARWPAANRALLRSDATAISHLPIDHSVPPVAVRGGEAAARAALHSFLDDRLPRYAEARNDIEADASSGLSPYLHFGHLSSHEIFRRLAERERWTPASIAESTNGAREGWWGMSRSAEAFLDQLVTWRELGFNFCAHRDDYDRFEALPEWARRTLGEHAADPRSPAYDAAALEAAATHDPLWNAAQTQLVREGRIHNYLRMLWGKKILEWTHSPEEALEVMIALNDKYAVDGRDPNSYSGISWVLGRYDRPWGPRRPIFGTVRYMSSESTARKMSVKGYLARYAPAGAMRSR